MIILIPMDLPAYRRLLREYIREQAQPPDKFSHQPRLYALARSLAESKPYDDDVLYAAAWLHDLGVFTGHRPENLAELARWDNVAYAIREAPGLLQRFGFPTEKIASVLEVIRTHQPAAEPTSFEGELLRDADILEQLGAVGLLRTVSKVGRDTRYPRFSDVLAVLRTNVETLPKKLRLESARAQLEPRVAILRSFLDAAEREAGGIPW
jgi:uncharacterized protein